MSSIRQIPEHFIDPLIAAVNGLTTVCQMLDVLVDCNYVNENYHRAEYNKGVQTSLQFGIQASNHQERYE